MKATPLLVGLYVSQMVCSIMFLGTWGYMGNQMPFS